ncbi:MAG: hypothetical protein GDA44_10135 [Prochloron sp. SP5CPC1]|nr:hypothetical protein [Candidatus Paraprochloron terpiosi SP5CPC1]
MPQLVEEILTLICKSREDIKDILGKLVPHLPEALISEVLAIVSLIHDEYEQTETFIELSTYRSQLLSETLDRVCSTQNEEVKGEGIRLLTSHLPQELMGQALEAACSIKDEKCRYNTLEDIVPNLPKDTMEQVLEAISSLSTGTKL